jgi:hypothetical protein
VTRAVMRQFVVESIELGAAVHIAARATADINMAAWKVGVGGGIVCGRDRS